MRVIAWVMLAWMPAIATLVAAAPAGQAVATKRTAPVGQAAPRPALETAVDRAAAALIASHASAGFAIAVSDRGGIVLAKGYGAADLEHGVHVAPDTVFRIGSITKEFTASAILLLAERGKLSLDDPLATYFPAFPRASEVTLRQLLNHTSGIANYTNAPGFALDDMPRQHSTAQMVALIARAQPAYDFAPGTRWNYSNSGYYLLGAIVERVSGQPLAAFLKANIFDPLGLADTRLDDLAEIVPARAAGYDKAVAAPSGFVNAGFISLSVAEGAGAIRSTALDLVKWHAALLGGRLLKPASLQAMTSPGLLKDGRPSSAGRAAPATPSTAGPAADPPGEYGFGLMLGQRDGRRTIGHGGAINGFNASVLTYPDSGITIAVLCNTTGASAAVTPALTAAVFAGRGGSGK